MGFEDIRTGRFNKELDPEKVTVDHKKTKTKILLELLEHSEEETENTFSLEFTISTENGDPSPPWKGKKGFGCSKIAAEELYEEIKQYFQNGEYEIQLQSGGDYEIRLPDQIICSR